MLAPDLSTELVALRDRLRPSRPRAAPPALGSRARFRALVGGRAHRRVRARVVDLEPARGGGVQRLDGRGARCARVGGRSRRDRPLPVEHLHGDAARGDQRRRQRRVRRLQPRRPLHVVRRPRAEGARAQAARGLPRPHRRPPRVRVRPDRGALPERGDRPPRGLRPRARRRVERPPRRAAGATPGSGRSRRPRRSRPARAACSSPRNPEVVEFARAFRNYGKPDYARARPELPPERVHRGDRARADDAARRDHGVEERGGADASRPALRLAARSCPTG